MSVNHKELRQGHRRWAFLLPAAMLLLACATVAGVGQTFYGPFLAPGTTPPAATAIPPSSAEPIALAPTIAPGTTPTLMPPADGPIQPPMVSHPIITELEVQVDERARTIMLGLAASVASERKVDEAFLWYDTEMGQQVHRFSGPLPPNLSLHYRLDAQREGLIMTGNPAEARNPILGYWWLVRDTSGESVRAGGTVDLKPPLQELVVTREPTPAAIDFTWGVSASQHYTFHFVPDSAAERDLFIIGPIAEAALTRTSAALDASFEGKMSVYLTPRIFWQGAATYGDKVQLISYLDRNYTAVEIWSYFTHEGTHALAQDLAGAFENPEQEGHPDGVLVEGLAVWASGGHYRQEPLDMWAAVIAASDAYIPLSELREGPFYDFQHEISYLEAASFVKYLIAEYGLDRFKKLYGLATGDPAHDQRSVERLYGQSYDQLERAWLDHLDGLEPTLEQAETWHLTRRSFDLTRRYETEMDPDARILPSSPPPAWTTDTLEIFLHRKETPKNIVLETSLIAAQERLYGGDLKGAALLLDDIEAALDAKEREDALDRSSQVARKLILELVAAQDRAVLTADAGAYLSTVRPTTALAEEKVVADRLGSPFTAYRQEVVRLDVADDGLSAQGVVLIHSELAQELACLMAPVCHETMTEDGQLQTVTFAWTQDGWLMTSRTAVGAILAPLPAARD